MNTTSSTLPENISILVLATDGQTWLKKEAGIRRWVSEKLFGSYRDQMEKLREVDDQIREWTSDLNKLFKNAKSAQARGRALDVVFWLSEINKRLKLSVTEGQNVADLQDEQLEEFLGTGDQEILEDYFSNPDAMKLSTAGLIDSIGQRLTRWKLESIYKARLAAQRKAIQALIRLAESTLIQVSRSLNVMNKARSSGNIPDYIDGLKRIAVAQKNFEDQFKNIFNAHFKQMAARMRAKKFQPTEEPKLAPNVELPPTMRDVPAPTIKDPSQEVSVPQIPSLKMEEGPATVPAAPIPEAFAPAPINRQLPDLIEEGFQDLETKPSQPLAVVEGPSSADEAEAELAAELAEAGAPPPATVVEVVEPTKKKAPKKPSKKKSKSAAEEQIEQAILKMNHQKFYQELEKAAQLYPPKFLAAMLVRYSEEIDDKDPETSANLLRVAQGFIK